MGSRYPERKLPVSGCAGAAGVAVPGTWVRVVIRTDQNGRSSVVVGGSELIAPTAQSGLGVSGSVGLRVGQLRTSESWYVDDARDRRMVSPEPTTTISGIDSPEAGHFCGDRRCWGRATPPVGLARVR
jgi:hypothetical protein